MHLSKLVRVLKSFDRQQFTRLKWYLHSPYFGVYPQSLLLFDYLASRYPFFVSSKISFEKVAEQHQALRSLQQQEVAGVRLLRAIEKFIAQEAWQKNNADVKRYQLKGLKELDLPDDFDKHFKKEMTRVNDCTEQHVNTFLDRHLLTELSSSGFTAKMKRTQKNDLMQVVESLDAYYSLKKLRYLCEAINRKRVLGAKYREEHVPALLKMLQPYNNVKYPYVYLFVNVYHLLTAETFEDSNLYYQLIKQFAERNGSTQTTFEVMIYAINQSLQWNNKGYAEAGDEYLWWIEWRMKNNLLLERGKLQPVTFRNIISIAVYNKKEPAIIEKLIKRYSSLLPEEHYDTYHAFAMGLYYYRTKNHVKAIRYYLQAQAKEETKFNSIIRHWQWLSLFECDPNDTDTLYNHLLSFEKYLQRHQQELQSAASAYDLFLSYAFKLLKADPRRMSETFLIHLKNEEHFPGKTWLIEQFNNRTRKGFTPKHAYSVKALAQIKELVLRS